MKIIKANFDELDNVTLYEILKLRVDIFVVEQNCPYPELDDKDQQAIHYYLKENNQVVSYLRVMKPSTSKGVIGRIVTRIDYRGNGLGTDLIQEAIKDLKGKTETVFLQGQSHLQKYYESFGFEKISDPYMYDGIPHIDMELSFSQDKNN